MILPWLVTNHTNPNLSWMMGTEDLKAEFCSLPRWIQNQSGGDTKPPNQPTIGGSKPTAIWLAVRWMKISFISSKYASNIHIGNNIWNMFETIWGCSTYIFIWEQHSNSCNAPGTGITPLRPPMTNLKDVSKVNDPGIPSWFDGGYIGHEILHARLTYKVGPPR